VRICSGEAADRPTVACLVAGDEEAHVLVGAGRAAARDGGRHQDASSEDDLFIPIDFDTGTVEKFPGSRGVVRLWRRRNVSVNWNGNGSRKNTCTEGSAVR
jgi:hypothetical protein